MFWYDIGLTSMHVEVKDIICLCKCVALMVFQSKDKGSNVFIQMPGIFPGALSSTAKELFLFS